jgi:hypothetical protein
VDGDTEAIFEMKFGKDLTVRFRRLSKWKQQMLMEDLRCALENRLKVLERA